MKAMARHTDEEIERAAERFERWTDDLDPAHVKAHSIDDLHQVADASDAVRADEVRLREAVQSARAHGRSWNQISVALGVSPPSRPAALHRQGQRLTLLLRPAHSRIAMVGQWRLGSRRLASTQAT